MRYPLGDIPDAATVTVLGQIATITLGEVVFTAQITADELVLFPERSVKQRDFLKMMGRIVD